MWQWIPNDTSKLTVELDEIIKSGIDIWNFEYPSFYTGEAKTKFEQKVIDHYRFRQIGQETPGRWLHYFRARIREIMPYYIQLYESEKLMQEIEDPFATVDYTETFEQTTTGESTGSTSDKVNTTANNTEESSRSGTENREHRFSNTPQGVITETDFPAYLTEASVDVNGNTETNSGTNSTTGETTSSGSTTGSSSGTVKHTLTKKGAMGVTTFGHDMIEYRQSFLNIDLMVIRELNDLFLQVY